MTSPGGRSSIGIFVFAVSIPASWWQNGTGDRAVDARRRRHPDSRVAGDYVCVLTSQAQLMCLTPRREGRGEMDQPAAALDAIPRYDQRPCVSGPVLVSDRLILSLRSGGGSYCRLGFGPIRSPLDRWQIQIPQRRPIARSCPYAIYKSLPANDVSDLVSAGLKRGRTWKSSPG